MQGDIRRLLLLWGFLRPGQNQTLADVLLCDVHFRCLHFRIGQRLANDLAKVSEFVQSHRWFDIHGSPVAAMSRQ